MTRHINLMTPDMRPGQGKVQLPLFAAVLALTLLAGGIYLGVHAAIGSWIQRQIDTAQQQVDTSALDLHRMRQNYPSIASEDELRANNEALQTRLTSRREELRGLTSQIDIAASGFARPLASLSEHDLAGLWLTRIELRDSHSHLELEGMARQPNLIPRYLGQLEGAVFQGLSIRNLNIEQSDSQLWRFSIAETLDTPPSLEELLQ